MSQPPPDPPPRSSRRDLDPLSGLAPDSEEDLGDPGPGDDRAFAASYLYEQLIDALVVFASRYIRTALLLARRPSNAADQLLEDLDQERGRYTRPLAFLAISYLLFSALLAWLPWMGGLLETGVVDALPSAGAPSLAVPIDQFVQGFGDVETDYLVVAVLAPLPAVILVSLASNLVGNGLVRGSRYSRSRFAAMVQYAVGLGLFSLVWLFTQSLLLLKVLVELAEATLATAPTVPMLVLTLGFLLWGVLLTVASTLLIVGMATVPVWRMQKVLPDLAARSPLVRGALSLAGPLVLASTLLGIGGLVRLSDELTPPPVQVHEASRASTGSSGRFDIALQASDDGPVAVLDWGVLWVDGVGDDARCERLTIAGRFPGEDYRGRMGDVSFARAEVSLLGESEAILDAGRLLMGPGQAIWMRLEAERPAAITVEPGMSRVTGDAAAEVSTPPADTGTVVDVLVEPGGLASPVASPAPRSSLASQGGSRDLAAELRLRRRFSVDDARLCVRLSDHPDQWVELHE